MLRTTTTTTIKIWDGPSASSRGKHTHTMRFDPSRRARLFADVRALEDEPSDRSEPGRREERRTFSTREREIFVVVGVPAPRCTSPGLVQLAPASKRWPHALFAVTIHRPLFLDVGGFWCWTLHGQSEARRALYQTPLHQKSPPPPLSESARRAARAYRATPGSSGLEGALAMPSPKKTPPPPLLIPIPVPFTPSIHRLAGPCAAASHWVVGGDCCPRTSRSGLQAAAKKSSPHTLDHPLHPPPQDRPRQHHAGVSSSKQQAGTGDTSKQLQNLPARASCTQNAGGHKQQQKKKDQPSSAAAAAAAARRKNGPDRSRLGARAARGRERQWERPPRQAGRRVGGGGRGRVGSQAPPAHRMVRATGMGVGSGGCCAWLQGKKKSPTTSSRWIIHDHPRDSRPFFGANDD
jgi:hypothetical protein